MFYYWHALIHMLAKYSCHSLQHLELAGLAPPIFNDQSKSAHFNFTFDSMSSLTNLKVSIYFFNLIISLCMYDLCINTFF